MKRKCDSCHMKAGEYPALQAKVLALGFSSEHPDIREMMCHSIRRKHELEKEVSYEH